MPVDEVAQLGLSPSCEGLVKTYLLRNPRSVATARGFLRLVIGGASRGLALASGASLELPHHGLSSPSYRGRQTGGRLIR